LVGCVRLADKAAPASSSIATRLDDIRASTGVQHTLVANPVGSGPFPALVLIHDDFGRTNWVTKQAERLAGRGYVVLAVDLYHGQALTDLMDAHIMSRGLPQDQVMADLKAAVDHLSRLSNVRKDAIGILGWGMGGGYALDAALQDSRLRAVATCYGRLTTDPALLAPLQAPVLGIFAGRDEGISPETIEQFRTAMQRAGKRVAGIHVYPECGHGFLNPEDPGLPGKGATEATADAWKKIEDFLAAELHP
jgi:carboxymethylenebutenolidase